MPRSVSAIHKLFTKSVKRAVTSKSYQAGDIFAVLLFEMKNYFLQCVRCLIIAYISRWRANLKRDTGHTLLGIENILISWFAINLALLVVALLSVCCLIHCNLNLC